MLRGEGKQGGQADIAERAAPLPSSFRLCFIGWGFDLVGRGGPGCVPYLCVHMYSVTSPSPFPSLCLISLLLLPISFCRACLEMVPCGCCCCLLSTWKPWTCSLRSSLREWDWAECEEATGTYWEWRSLLCLRPQVWRSALALWSPDQPPASPGPQCLEHW